jgi:asparagine synthase (glutamine-hydrolysing)
VDCLQRFVGMFAFAIWDQRRGRLFCARDRFGIKPFYYTAQRDQFAFASEIKALRPLNPAAYTPDMSQLFWFLHYGLIYNPPHTFFEGVRELPGGHYLLVENGVVRDPVKWWDIDLERARATYNYADPEGEFLRLLRESVTLRLRSDVPVGTCLSGGLDSSAIVALAVEQLNGGRINSFSSVYPVRGFDEARYVELVAARYHTIRHVTTPSPDNWLAQMERITWHQDIPTVSPGVYSQNFVMKLAQGSVTVLLDGQGADELMAGYLSAVMFHLSALRRRDPLRWIGQQAAFMAEAYPRFFAQFNAREMAYRFYQYATLGRQPARVLKPEFQARAHEREADQQPRRLTGADDLNQHLYQQVMRDSIPSLLHYEDRNSMAYSIEARVPFLDHRLAEFALGVPGDLKVKGPVTKRLMRRALRGVLPDEVVNRRDKLGYPTPFGQWLRADQTMQRDVRAYLFDQAVRRDWLDRPRIERMWEQHIGGQRSYSQSLYALITAEQWLTHVEAAT